MNTPSETNTTASGASPETVAITLEGNLTVENIAPIHARIRQALEGGNSVRLEFGEIGNIDLTFLQLVCSAHRTARVQMGREFSLPSALPPKLQQIGAPVCECHVNALAGLPCLWGKR